ncbi:MAG TPA: phosphoenolpyruvate synthase [Candidatus Paceibacterota bacterium]
MDKSSALILWFDQVSNDDVALVGGKNASLGEMYRLLQPQGVRIPNGFIVTARGYQDFISAAGLGEFINRELTGLDVNDIKTLQSTGHRIRSAFLKYQFPPTLEQAIREAYRNLSNAYQVPAVDTAVRSSATAEDLPGASFAGEHETFLNVVGEERVLDAIRAAFASLFNDRAISYRVDKGFAHDKISLSVGVQKMVRSDVGTSGVMFTLDPETGFRDVVTINSSWGLGEMVVQGKVTPDEFLVHKPTLRRGFRSIIRKNLGEKAIKMIYHGDTPRAPVKEIATSPAERAVFSLTDDEVLELARWGLLIEDHYSVRAGHPMPMDIEWAKDGVRNELYIVQARPETVQAEKTGYLREEYKLIDSGPVITEGISVGAKIATGAARVILSTDKLAEFKAGEILVTEITDPDWEPIMKEAAAIITEKGGRTSHAAIVSRELGIAAIVGAAGALKKIKTGEVITVDTSSGDVGKIYAGALKFDKKTYDLAELPKIQLKLALNVGTPDGAFMYASLPHHGVGLAREEFIIASHIKVHPLALLNFDTLSSPLKKKIEAIISGYPSPREFYIRKLAEGIAQITAAFAPHQVIVRFSDFKTNEYRALLGGEFYEPEEENPMLGWRGAARYAHPNFRPAFELECRAVAIVRDEFGLKNLKVMVPFCRTPDEGRQVIETMRNFGLTQGGGPDDLKVYVMCEIPANVLRADEFLDIFDGFSIGSNDLTQLTLGLDRDSSIVAGIANENDPAVKTLVAQAIAACKRRGKYIGICGQAPSDYPEFLRFLVREGIDSISLNPDSIVPMTLLVAAEEKKLVH